MIDLAFQSAKRLARRIHRRGIGCAELLDHYLARVDRFNPGLNAIIETCIPAVLNKGVDSVDRIAVLAVPPPTVYFRVNLAAAFMSLYISAVSGLLASILSPIGRTRSANSFLSAAESW